MGAPLRAREDRTGKAAVGRRGRRGRRRRQRARLCQPCRRGSGRASAGEERAAGGGRVANHRPSLAGRLARGASGRGGGDGRDHQRARLCQPCSLGSRGASAEEKQVHGGCCFAYQRPSLVDRGARGVSARAAAAWPPHRTGPPLLHVGLDPADGPGIRVQVAYLLSAWDATRLTAQKELQSKAEHKAAEIAKPIATQELAALRQEPHATWPLPRRSTRAERREADARAAVLKAEKAEQQAQAAAQEAREEAAADMGTVFYFDCDILYSQQKCQKLCIKI